ncbi:hypothetical protein Tco_0610259 [Tanacetum coccineum]
MSSYTHPSIPSDYDVEDAFSSTNAPNYIPTPPGYSLVTPGNISPDSSDDLTKDLLSSLSILPFHDDPYMKETSPPKDTETPVESPILVSPSSSVRSSSPVRSTTPSPDYPFDEILESCKRHRTQKQQGRTTKLEFSRIQPLDVSERLLMKLEDSEDEHQVYGRIVRIKRLLGVNTAKVGKKVTTAERLQLLEEFLLSEG